MFVYSGVDDNSVDEDKAGDADDDDNKNSFSQILMNFISNII